MSKKSKQIQAKSKAQPAVPGGNGDSNQPPEEAPATVMVLPEPAEPRADKRPLPVWLIVLLFVLLYWGDMYVMEHGADLAGKGGPFPTMVYDPFRSYEELDKANPVTPEEAERRKGQQVYNFICVQCHQLNGQGVPGQFPPLAGSEWVLTEGAERPIHIVLNGVTGPITVKGGSYNNTMPPWKATLSDEQIAHVLTFVRKQWGNSAPSVAAEEVAQVRAQVKARGDAPFTAAELQAVPEKPAQAPVKSPAEALK